MATPNTSCCSSLSTNASKMFHSFKTSTGMLNFTLLRGKEIKWIISIVLLLKKCLPEAFELFEPVNTFTFQLFLRFYWIILWARAYFLHFHPANVFCWKVKHPYSVLLSGEHYCLSYLIRFTVFQTEWKKVLPWSHAHTFCTFWAIRTLIKSRSLNT